MDYVAETVPLRAGLCVDADGIVKAGGRTEVAVVDEAMLKMLAAEDGVLRFI